MAEGDLAIEALSVELGDASGPTAELAPEVRSALYDAWLAAGILLFNGVDTTARHLALSRCFGELELHPVPELRSEEHPLLAEIGGRKRKPAYVYDGVVLADRLAWHRDTAYTLDLCKGGMLRMVEIPSSGGETLFADTAFAYEDLPADVKGRLEGLEYKATLRITPMEQTRPGALWKSVRPATREEDPTVAYFVLEGAAVRRFRSVIHPVVLTHPETGRKCIFISPTYVDCFLDIPQPESRELLEYLVAHMLKPRYVYKHRWRANQCIVWDNLRFIHAALGQSPLEPRRGLRTTLASTVRTGRFID
jgi:taurine dioxygenase